jgi:hypothetical protein
LFHKHETNKKKRREDRKNRKQPGVQISKKRYRESLKKGYLYAPKNGKRSG